MQAVSRRYAMAAAALAATSVVAVTPIVPRVAELPVVSMATRLVDSSIANIPLNLFYDLVNIPANELHATQFFTDNLFMAGPWFVVSPTNLWGVDPGDPTHFMSVENFLIPFPELSGMNAPETDFSAGLGQQLWGFVASELPTSASCDAAACAPFEPSSPITGLQGVDFYAWLGQVLSGQEKFPLFDNWFNAQYVNGQFFFDPAADGSTDPSGAVHSFDGWSSMTGLLGGQGIPGTGVGDAMPWSGETYTFEPWVPVENFFNSLMADPVTTGLGGTGIDPIYGDPTEIAQTMQAFMAGLTFFDPFTPGSPFCADTCAPITSAHMDYPDLIKEIGNMMPGNPVINEWLADYGNGTANVPTAEQIANSIALLQNHNFWDFQDPPYVGNNTPGSFDIATLAPQFHQFWEQLGFNVPPLNDPGAYPAEAASSVDPSQLASSMTALTAMLGTSSISDFLSTMTADLTTQLQADFSAMLASLAADLPANFASTLPADLLTLF
ncbi:MAG: hypothetical protein WB785_06245 [Mycobacterium sp.]|uniref:hypothetical protein n=1 Tax=Mycobacterium sp. TaxID=1785 RepID=UPI003C3EE8F4